MLSGHDQLSYHIVIQLSPWGSEIQLFKIWKHFNLDFFKIKFKMVWFSEGWAMAKVPTI